MNNHTGRQMINLSKIMLKLSETYPKMVKKCFGYKYGQVDVPV